MTLLKAYQFNSQVEMNEAESKKWHLEIVIMAKASYRSFSTDNERTREHSLVLDAKVGIDHLNLLPDHRECMQKKSARDVQELG